MDLLCHFLFVEALGHQDLVDSEAEGKKTHDDDPEHPGIALNRSDTDEFRRLLVYCQLHTLSLKVVDWVEVSEEGVSEDEHGLATWAHSRRVGHDGNNTHTFHILIDVLTIEQETLRMDDELVHVNDEADWAHFGSYLFTG